MPETSATKGALHSGERGRQEQTEYKIGMGGKTSPGRDYEVSGRRRMAAVTEVHTHAATADHGRY